MTRRQQIVMLCGLLAVLAIALFVEFRPDSGDTPIVAPAAAVSPYAPLGVENPALRLDELDRVRNLQYTGQHRNIFSATIPPPPPPVLTKAQIKAQQEALRNQPPPPPPPLQVPATFFGYVTDKRTGNKQAFFTDGDDVFIAGEGELLLGRFRVLKIGNDTAEVEEVSSGRHATLPLQNIEPAG
jgi:hypothetical protein